jgi:hypothetical protein
MKNMDRQHVGKTPVKDTYGSELMLIFYSGKVHVSVGKI